MTAEVLSQAEHSFEDALQEIMGKMDLSAQSDSLEKLNGLQSSVRESISQLRNQK